MVKLIAMGHLSRFELQVLQVPDALVEGVHETLPFENLAFWGIQCGTELACKHSLHIFKGGLSFGIDGRLNVPHCNCIDEQFNGFLVGAEEAKPISVQCSQIEPCDR